MFIRYFILFVLLFPSLHAEESATDSLAVTEGLPSNIIAGCVCAITGEFFDNETDLVLDGPEPLIIQRSYSSNDPGGNISTGWSLNHYDTMAFSDYESYGRKHLSILLTQPSSARLCYEYDMDTDQKVGKMTLIPFYLKSKKGLTNGASGEVSGRTNIKNQTVDYYPQENRIEVITGARHSRKFEIIPSSKHHNSVALQSTEDKVNGHTFQYNRNKDHYLKEIVAHNRFPFCRFSSVHIDSKEKDDKITIHLIPSIGKGVVYHTKRHREKKSDIITLSKVERPCAPTTTYEYTCNDDRSSYLINRKQQNDCFKGVNYYRKGSNHLGELGRITPEDFCINRVSQIIAPVGEDPEGVVTHSFLYEAELKDKEVLNGKTHVFDAYFHKTTYEYDKDHRLRSVERFRGTYPKLSPYSTEKYVWGKGQDEGNLIGKYLKDASGEIHSARYFVYDAKGNILQDTLYGNLTGRNTKQVQLGTDKRPLDGPESYSKTFEYEAGMNLLLCQREPDGRATKNVYIPSTDYLSAQFAMNDQQIHRRTFFKYDNNGVLIRKVVDDGSSEQRGNLAHVTERQITIYEPQNQAPYHLPRVTEQRYRDAYGQEKLLKKTISSYTPEGKLKKQEHYDSEETYRYTLYWKYDAHGNVISETNALGLTITRQYDDNDNLIYQQGPGSDFYTQYTYDLSNRLIKEVEFHTDGNRFVTKHRYDYRGNRTSTIDPHGYETNFHYDAFNRLVKIELPADFEGKRAVIKKEYNIAGSLVAEIDPKGQKTTFQNNIRGKPLQIHYPDGTQVQFFYFLNGEPSKKIEKNGKAIQYKRDHFGRVISEKSNDKTLTHEYNTFRLLRTTDSEGLVTNYSYDEAGRLITTCKGDQKIVNSYDALGRVSQIQEWISPTESRIHKKQYDDLDRVIEERIEDEHGRLYSYARYEFDARGNQTYIQKGEEITRTEYNGHNKPTKISDALGNETYISYNHYHVLFNQYVLQVTTTDPTGLQTIQTFDPLGRLYETVQRNPYGIALSCHTISYDLNNNPVHLHDIVYDEGRPLKEIHTYQYFNAANQLIRLEEASQTADQKITTYEYNSLGQKSRIIKPSGIQIDSLYDQEGRLKELISPHFHYVYEYNLADLPIKVTDKLTGKTTERIYDIQGQLLQEKLANDLTLNYTYDQVGRYQSMTLPDKSKITYRYDSANLREVNYKNYTHYEHSHTLSGQVTHEQRYMHTYTTYDPLGRITSMEHPHTKQIDINYDPFGNLLSYQSDYTSHNFTYNELHQITSENDHTYQYDSHSTRIYKDNQLCISNHLNQILSQGDQVYTYDFDGNLTYKGAKYDALDRLVSMNNVQYEYDSFNRRITRQENGQVHKFIYQGLHEIGRMQDDKILELKIIKPEKRGRSVAIELSGTIYEPHHDLFGNVTSLHSYSGEVVEEYTFTAFGEETIIWGGRNPWRYADRRIDETTRLINFGFRDYDPVIGQWTSRDPLGYEDGRSLYAYVHANPLHYFDTHGLSSDSVFFAPKFELPCFTFGLLDIIGNGHIGAWLEGTNIYHLDPESKEITTNMPIAFAENFRYGITHVNGIQNTRQDLHQALQHIDKIAPDIPKAGIHQPARGLMRDTVKWAFTTYGNVAFESVEQILGRWDSFFDRAPADALHFHSCHSWGCGSTDMALRSYDHARRKRIMVTATCPGKYIDRELCHDVLHVECYSDLVPRLDGSGRSMALAQGTIQMVGDPTVWYNPTTWYINPFNQHHSFTDPLYVPVLRDRIAEYRKKNGIK